MSVGGLFTSGTSALSAAYAQLQTTGHNIANVNTPGYSREEVVLTSAGGDMTGGGWVGRGVSIATVTRLYDQFLTTEVTTSTAAAASDKARSDQLGSLDRMFASSQNGIGAAVDDLTSGFADMVNRPFDTTARAVVVSRAGVLADRIGTAYDNLNQIRENVDQRVAQDIQSLNSTLTALGSLNDRIAKSAAQGQPPNDLLDQRDALIDKVNQSLKTSQYINQDGTVSLFSASGQAMVVGNTVATLGLQTDTLDPSKQQLVMKTSGHSVVIPNSMLGGGEIDGLIRFRDEDLQSARTRLGQLAAALSEAYNTQQSLGRDPSGAAGAALFSYSPPVSSAASDNTGNGSFSVSVANGAQLAASDYQIGFDGTNYTVTRTSDNTSWSVSTWPQTIDGLSMNLSGGTPLSGDRFQVNAGSVYASRFTRTLSSGARLASGLAASPQLGATNTGDTSVSTFAVTSNDPNLMQQVTLSFDGAGHFSVSGTGTGNPSGLAYTPGMTVSYNGWSMQLDGQPAAGDTLGIAATPNPANDNRNARSLVSLADKLNVNGSTFSDAFSQILSDIGVRTQSAQAASSLTTQVLNDAKSSKSQVSGVNLDEEAARLLQYQQAYQAAAKLISTAQTLFQTLMQATGG